MHRPILGISNNSRMTKTPSGSADSDAAGHCIFVHSLTPDVGLAAGVWQQEASWWQCCSHEGAAAGKIIPAASGWECNQSLINTSGSSSMALQFSNLPHPAFVRTVRPMM